MKKLVDLEFSDMFLVANDNHVIRRANSESGEEIVPLEHDYFGDADDLLKKIGEAEAQFQGRKEFSVLHDGVVYRTTVIDDINGKCYAVRKGASKIPSLSECGIHSEIVSHLLQSREGLIIVSGSFSSGKTTTVSSFVKDFCSTGKVVVTLEDPPELPLSGIHGNGRCFQIPVDRTTIDREMEAALRMSFDLLFVSEIRTPAMAKEVIAASINGKMIITTIHSDNVINAIVRLLSLAYRTTNGSDSEEKGLRDMLGEGLLCAMHMSHDIATGRRGVSEYLVRNNDVRAKICANELAGLQNSVNMIRNRLTMNLPVFY